MGTAAATDLPARVAEACRTHLGLRRGAAVLVGVSGGADSSALACLLADVGTHGLALRLVLGHVDHGWRGPDEAAADRRCVEALGEALALPVCCSPRPPADTPRTEDAARRWRYRQLAVLAREARCAYVATGHHAGDQAETFLMRLLRGSGLVGLAGIPRARPLHPGRTVVRPLLDLEPGALRRYLAQRGVRWREDATNADRTRERAAMRARLQGTHAATLAELAGRLRRRLERRIARIEHVVAETFVHHLHAGAVAMPRRVLAPLHGEDLALALRAAGHRLGADRDGPWFVRRHVERFEALLASGGALDLPHGLFLHVAGNTAWLAWRAPPARALPALVRRDVERAAFDLDAWRAQAPRTSAALDAERLGPAPVVRLLQDDDRFTPLGATRETSVKAWLSRQGVPGFARRGQLAVEGDHGVAWVVGRRPDAGHAVGADTRRVAVLEVR